MNSEVKTKLVNYGKEMGLYSVLTLDMLIQSHRTLRVDAQKTNAEKMQLIADAQKRASDAARVYALSHDFISREELKGMTVAKLVELLGDDND